jgi:hypothetical protein
MVVRPCRITSHTKVKDDASRLVTRQGVVLVWGHRMLPHNAEKTPHGQAKAFQGHEGVALVWKHDHPRPCKGVLFVLWRKIVLTREDKETVVVRAP